MQINGIICEYVLMGEWTQRWPFVSIKSVMSKLRNDQFVITFRRINAEFWTEYFEIKF